MYKQEAVNNKIIHPLQFTMILKILNNGKKCGGNNSNVFVTDIFPIQIFNKYNVDQYITVVKLAGSTLSTLKFNRIDMTNHIKFKFAFHLSKGA